MKTNSRWRRLAPLAVAVILAPVLAQIGIAVPAGAARAAMTITMFRADSITNSAAFKTAEAFCPPGQHVVGGGGWVQETGATSGKLALTRLRPVHAQNGRDSYLATGGDHSRHRRRLVGPGVCHVHGDRAARAQNRGESPHRTQFGGGAGNRRGLPGRNSSTR